MGYIPGGEREMKYNVEKMIAELCPTGVLYCEMGKLAQIGTGKSNGNEAEDNGEYPFFIRSPIVKRKNCYEYDEEAIIIPGEGGVGDIFHYINGKYALHQRVYRIHFTTKDVDTRFMYYYLSANFKVFIQRKAVNATVTSIRKPMIEQFPIPLPPLPIQQEIVRILDTFTNFTAELTDKLNAELTARRKQYEYYRDELLKTGEQVSLYEVAQYSKDRILASELTDENYVGVDNLLPNKQGKIKSEHTPIEGKFVRFVKEDILIGNIRPYLKKIWFSDCVGGTNGDVLTIRVIDKERVLPRFLYFVLSTESFFNYDMNNAKGAKMPRGDKKAVMNYQFYLPSLEIQEKVVSILETFDNLCNGFEYGLPAEIYARQQQYEYYRDKLLNFKELHNKED